MKTGSVVRFRVKLCVNSLSSYQITLSMMPFNVLHSCMQLGVGAERMLAAKYARENSYEWRVWVLWEIGDFELVNRRL